MIESYIHTIFRTDGNIFTHTQMIHSRGFLPSRTNMYIRSSITFLLSLSVFGLPLFFSLFLSDLHTQENYALLDCLTLFNFCNAPLELHFFTVLTSVLIRLIHHLLLSSLLREPGLTSLLPSARQWMKMHYPFCNKIVSLRYSFLM